MSKWGKIWNKREIEELLARYNDLYGNQGHFPLSDSEFKTLAKRINSLVNSSVFASASLKKAKLEKYKNHLERTYSTEQVEKIINNLSEIKNNILYENR